MSATEIQQLSDLFRQAAQAHHKAFVRKDQDPEWPLWYAEYLQPRIRPYLAEPISKSNLVCWLLKTEKARVVADWPTVYALKLLEEYGKEGG